MKLQPNYRNESMSVAICTQSYLDSGIEVIGSPPEVILELSKEIDIRF